MIKSSLVCMSVAAVLSFAGSAFAADDKKDECTFHVYGTDTMKYTADAEGKTDLKEIKVPEKCRGKDITFTLKHVGKLPATAMGHNLVIIDSTKQAAIVADGLKAGPAAGYVPAKADGMVDHTKTIGGGEETTLKIAKGTFKAATNYGFVCTFPGHAALMNGKITFVK